MSISLVSSCREKRLAITASSRDDILCASFVSVVRHNDRVIEMLVQPLNVGIPIRSKPLVHVIARG